MGTKRIDRYLVSVQLTAKEWLWIIENIDGWDAVKEKIFLRLLK